MICKICFTWPKIYAAWIFLNCRATSYKIYIIYLNAFNAALQAYQAASQMYPAHPGMYLSAALSPAAILWIPLLKIFTFIIETMSKGKDFRTFTV